MSEVYEKIIQWIHGLLSQGSKPGLERVKWMLGELSHPERCIKAIHIGGTNGKGSTASILSHLLQQGGWDVGMFTSPYIVRFNERISVNGEGISDDDLIEMANRVKPLVDELQNSDLGSPTEFEVFTVIAMLYFSTVAVPDFVLLEAGLGGRLDSTNVIHPLLSIITNVGYDHLAILGNHIEEIASEKAGIIKSGTPVITAALEPKALEVIRHKSKEMHAKLYVLGEDFSVKHNGSTASGESFEFQSAYKKRVNLIVGMRGEHQIENASLALMAVDYLKQNHGLILDEENIERGLEHASLPGRFEQFTTNPTIILDGAHNPEGIARLAKALKHYYSDQPINILFAAMKDKDINGMLAPLYKRAAKITFTSMSSDRAATAESLYEQCNFKSKFVTQDWRNLLSEILKRKHNSNIYIVTGSLYFISEVRQFLSELKVQSVYLESKSIALK